MEDVNQARSNSTSVRDTDICIVGGGPAGLTLAMELCDSNVRICVLEAGGDRAIDSTDALSFETTETVLEPAGDSRWRQLAGSAVIWNVRLRGQPAARYIRLGRIDFERRLEVQCTGWPFGYHELAPYYERAETLAIDCPATPIWTESAAPEQFDLDPEILTTTIESFGHASVFTSQLPAYLRRLPNVSIVTNAMVTNIKTNASGDRVEEVEVLSGRSRFMVRCRILVLAAGGIENARLLLLSNVHRGGGFGNEHDLVGRFFMDHPRVRLGYLRPFDSSIFEHASAYDIRQWNQRYLGGKITLAEQLIKHRSLLNASLQLIPRPNARDYEALLSMKSFVAGLRRPGFNRRTAQEGWRALAGTKYLVRTGVRLGMIQRRAWPVIADGGWSRLSRNRKRFEVFELVLQCEQSAHPENRVQLGTVHDEFGLRRVRVISTWTPTDLLSLKETTVILAEEFERAGIGRLLPIPMEVYPEPYQSGGAHHHMGTTRMHVDAREGVVNQDCRLHGMDNLFVAGSSVFPSGGYANPTLTILAMTIKLADFIKKTTHRW